MFSIAGLLNDSNENIGVNDPSLEADASRPRHTSGDSALGDDQSDNVCVSFRRQGCCLKAD